MERPPPLTRKKQRRMKKLSWPFALHTHALTYAFAVFCRLCIVVSLIGEPAFPWHTCARHHFVAAAPWPCTAGARTWPPFFAVLARGNRSSSFSSFLQKQILHSIKTPFFSFFYDRWEPAGHTQRWNGCRDLLWLAQPGEHVLPECTHSVPGLIQKRGRPFSRARGQPHRTRSNQAHPSKPDCLCVASKRRGLYL